MWDKVFLSYVVLIKEIVGNILPEVCGDGEGSRGMWGALSCELTAR